jgi:predicted phage baseplate assembly protein
MSTANRPGLASLAYRVATHGAFLETMKARLGNLSVEGVGPDGQTLQAFMPLKGLTTRDSGDPSIALLDGWATVGDVLTFYQELIANEGYLRTATERRSILELARLVGYSLRPGVAATVYLAYTLDDKQTDPVEIPIGSRSQSIPGPGEQPQSFETIEKVVARQEWSNLQVRLTQPQRITLDNVLSLPTVFAAGISTNLKAGDLLLFAFGAPAYPINVVRKAAEVNAVFADSRTEITLEPLEAAAVAALPDLEEFIRHATPEAGPPPDAVQRMVDEANRIIEQIRLGLGPSAEKWPDALSGVADGVPKSVDGFFATLTTAVQTALGTKVQPAAAETTDPSKFVTSLLKDPTPQARSSAHLSRRLAESLQRGSDAHPQILVNLAPRLRQTYYTAWANANLALPKGGGNGGTSGGEGAAAESTASLQSVSVWRVTASLFGSNVPDPAVDPATGKPPGTPLPIELDEATDALFLDQAHEAIRPGSSVLVQRHKDGKTQRSVFPVVDVQTLQRFAYTISGKTTRLSFPGEWWQGSSEADLGTLRSTLVRAQSEALVLAEEPLPDTVNADAATREVVLADLHKELTSGRWVIFSGERADIPGVKAVTVSELLMISALRHDFDPSLPGDRIHTTLILATPTAYSYRRAKITIYGNVAKATHGETRNETLGNGDGSQAHQSFELKQPPLTFVPAPSPSGVASTLHVYVNDVEWHETDTLAGTGPTDRIFITKTDDDAKTTVVFGNGREGSRVPTGQENVKSVYRNGIGKPGNVAGGQISMLVTKPLGVKAVVNPLPSSGGADKEDRDQARDNVPLALMALDRIVSLQDYADFTRTFAGIGKASAARLTDRRREVVHVTIAGAEDIPIDVTSDLYANLLAALRRFGDPDVPIEVQTRELTVLVIGAKVQPLPDYLWEPVATRVRAALLDTFGFRRRVLGQPALLCEVVGCIQNVEGVAWCDVETFGGIPEKRFDATQKARRLLTLDELADVAAIIIDPRGGSEARQLSSDLESLRRTTTTDPGPAERVDAQVAGFDDGVFRPAGLVIATPAVPDTIVLNQARPQP